MSSRFRGVNKRKQFNRGRGRGSFQSKRGRQDRHYVDQDGWEHSEELYEEREPSPQYRRSPTTAELDLQIEILKKQRMILEEERKILEEQQKLEEIKMKARMGGSVYNNVEESAPDPNASRKQSSYVKVALVLLKKMAAIVNIHSDLESRKRLYKRLRTTLQKRLADLVAVPPVYPTNKVIELYREVYPESEDEGFVLEHIEHLHEPNWVYGKDLEEDATPGPQTKGKKQAKNKAKNTNTEDSSEDDRRTFSPKLLSYYQATKIIVRKMEPVVQAHAPPEKRRAVLILLRHMLKEKFAAALEGRPIYRTHKVLQIYREKHPPSDDPALVREALKTIEHNNWSEQDVYTLFGSNKGRKAKKLFNETVTVKSESPVGEVSSNINKTEIEKVVEVKIEPLNNEEVRNKTEELGSTVKKLEEGAEEIINTIDISNNGVKAENSDANVASAEENIVAKEIEEGNVTVNAVANENEEPETKETGDMGSDTQAVNKGVKRKCSTDDEGRVAKSTNWAGDHDELEGWN